MEESFKREIPFDSDEIKALIKKRGEIATQGLEYGKELERLAKEHAEVLEKHNALIEEMNATRLEILAKAKELVGSQLAEYEAPITTKIVDDRVHLEVINLVDEYKSRFATFDPWATAQPSKE